MSNVVGLRSGQEILPVNQDAIDLLESVLEDFKSGKFKSFGLVCLDNQDETIECVWHTDGDVFRLLGGISRLNYRVNETISEQK